MKKRFIIWLGMLLFLFLLAGCELSLPTTQSTESTSTTSIDGSSTTTTSSSSTTGTTTTTSPSSTTGTTTTTSPSITTGTTTILTIPSYSVVYFVNGVFFQNVSFQEGQVLTFLSLGSETQIFSGWFEDESLQIPVSLTVMPGNTVHLYGTLVDKPKTYRLSINEFEIPPLRTVHAGSDFLVMLTQDGRILTLGSNTNNQLGDTYALTSYEFAYDITNQFQLEAGETIKLIHADEQNAIVATSNNRVFTWGSNFSGQLGIGEVHPQKMPLFVQEITHQFSFQLGEVINYVFTGHTSYLVTSHNRIFAWGLNIQGEIGDGTKIEKASPIETTAFYQLNGADIIYFSSSSRSVFLATSDQRLLVHGRNNGGLPTWSVNAIFSPENVLPRFVLEAGEQIKMIQRGDLHLQVLTTANKIYAFGNNDYFQFGTGYQNTFFNPTAVPMPLAPREEIVSIHVGSFHTVFLTSTNRVLSYGNRISPAAEHRAVLEVRFPYMAQRLITSIAVKENANYAVDEYGTLLVWGRDTLFGTFSEPVEKNIKIQVPTQTHELFEGAQILLESPTKEGALFDGWYSDIDLTIPWTGQSMPNHALNLYPKWIDFRQLDLFEKQEILFQMAIPASHIIIGLSLDHQVYLWGGSTVSPLHSLTPKNITNDFALAQDDEICTITAGVSHVLVLTKQGRLFGLGVNYELGPMFYPLTILAGMYPYQGGSFFNNKIPRPLELTRLFDLAEEEILTGVFSGEHTNLVTTSQNRVFLFGVMQTYEYVTAFDFRDPSRIEPLPIEINDFLGLLPGETILQFEATMFNFMVLTSNHRVLIWGENHESLLLEEGIERSYNPLDITAKLNLLENEFVTQFDIGTNNATYLTNLNRILRVGSTYFPDRSTSSITPKDVSSAFTLQADETIVKVVGDNLITMILTSNGRILVYGISTDRNGIGDSFTYPYAVDITNRFSSDHVFFVGLEMDKISVIATTASGEIYGWGSLRAFEDGLTRTISIPTKILASADQITDSFLLSDEINLDTILQDPERLGFFFGGWYEDAKRSIPFEPSTPREHSFSLYAKWETIYYSLYFDTAGGSPIDMQEHPYQTILSRPDNPIKIGYQFVGWYQDETFTEPFTFGNMPAQMLSIYAKFEPMQYTVQLNQETTILTSEIYTGVSHSVLITLDQEIYLFGKQDSLLFYEPYLITDQLNLDSMDSIVMAAMGEEHFFLLSSFGRLFAYGRNTEGVFGSKNYASLNQIQEVTSAYPIESDDQIVGVYTNFYQSMILTRSGRVFASGQNYNGNLAIGDNLQRDETMEITQNFSLLSGEKITMISLGESHGYAVSTANRIFLWGSEVTGVTMYLTHQITTHPLPINVTSRFTLEAEETITSISSGNLWSVFLTSTGKVLTVGINDVGQLGNNKALGHSVNPIDITPSADLSNQEKVMQISTGIAHLILRTNQGNVFVLGDSAFGATGLGRSADITTLTSLNHVLALKNLETIQFVSAGGDSSFVVTNLGRLFAFGDNSMNQLGDRLPNQEVRDITDAFHPLLLNERIASIAHGSEHSIALSTEGKLFSWGGNDFGQLGVNSTNVLWDKMNQVLLGYKVNKVVAGANFNLYMAGSALYSFGENTYGQLGNNDYNLANKLAPVRIDSQFGLKSGEIIKDVDAGLNHAIAYTSQNRVFTWGAGYFGALGDGYTSSYQQPIDITANLALALEESIVKVVAGANQSFVITSHHRVLSFGLNAYGSLGNHTKKNQLTPIDLATYVPLIEGEWIDDVFSGVESTMLITNLGNVYVAGRNHVGQLGIGSNEPIIHYFYHANEAYGLLPGERIIKADFGHPISSFGIFLTNQGRVFFMGRPNNHMLLNQSYSNRYFATDITAYFTLANGDEIVDIVAGDYYSTVTTKYGRILAWGSELYYDYFPSSLNTSSYRATKPIDLFDQEDIIAIRNGAENSVLLTSQGRIFVTGSGARGQYLDQTWASKNEYTEVSQYFPLQPDELVLDVGIGNFLYAITSNQRLLVWGNRSQNVLDITNQIVLQENEIYSMIAADGVATAAVLTSFGRLFMIGRNQGIYGNNEITEQTTFTETTSYYALNPEEKISMVSISNTHSMVLTNQNRIFTSGHNTSGALGDNTTVDKRTPVNITPRYTMLAGETISKIVTGLDFSGFITSQNRIFTWGSNSYGENGTGGQRHVPTLLNPSTRLGLKANEVVIDLTMNFYNSLVITNQGRILGWGDNEENQIHFSYGTARGIPSDLMTFLHTNPGETIVLVQPGYLYQTVITSQNRILTIGNNQFGQLGRGTLTNYYSPKEIYITQISPYESLEFFYQGEVVLPPPPLRDGYEFLYWSYDPAGVTIFEATNMPAYHARLYAIYKPVD